jgi:signal transduction histidine kinase
VKVAAAVLVFAVLCLLGGSVAWLRASGTAEAPPDSAGADGALADFQAQERSVTVQLDLAGRYAGRRDLLDPRLSLPAWHRFAREQAVAVHRATKACPPGEVPGDLDPALAKAYAWHRATCAASAAGAAGAAGEGAPFDRAPFIHPSGRSYAALALARGVGDPAATSAWTRAHVGSFHVLELAALDQAALDPDDRALAALPSHAWESLAHGDRLVLTADALVMADHGPLGLASLRIAPRAAWEPFARRRSLALVARGRSALCGHRASPELCWETVTSAERNRGVLVAWTTASALLVFAASLAVVVTYIIERRRMHADRIHVLRTLTHELRTPATSLRLDIEPLRAAYDELPAGCQEPLLRISDGIERLHRVLHRSARYMALFETPGASREQLVNVRDVPSARAMFAELADEWPEGVTLVDAPTDTALRTDPEWLGVAVRNLVENASRHGAPPIVVRWTFEDDTLVVRVSDGGSSEGLSVRRAVAPYARHERSPGLGLGLAIVDRVARLLRGRLSHEPSPTVFELRVPARAEVGA